MIITRGRVIETEWSVTRPCTSGSSQKRRTVTQKSSRCNECSLNHLIFTSERQSKWGFPTLFISFIFTLILHRHDDGQVYLLSSREHCVFFFFLLLNLMWAKEKVVSFLFITNSFLFLSNIRRNFYAIAFKMHQRESKTTLWFRQLVL